MWIPACMDRIGLSLAVDDPEYPRTDSIKYVVGGID